MADSRQISSQDTITQLSSTTPTELDNIVRSTNSELTPSLRIRITGSLQLTIDPLLVTNAETTRIHSIPPINNLLPFSFTGDIIAIPASNNGNITHTAGASLLLNITSGHYVRLGMSINSLGTVFLTLGTSSATKNLATAPAVPSNTFGIGHAILQNIGGTIQTVTEVIQYAGGGGGGGTGDTTGFMETLKNQLNDSVYEFATPNIISVDADTKVDASPTTATYNLVDSTYQFTKDVEANWVERSVSSQTWSGITWSPELGLFCAVSSDGTNRVMTSPDGITWTLQTATAASTWSEVVWSPELNLFVAVAQTGANLVMTSPDGITWTVQTAAAAIAWRSVTWSPELGLFCAVGTGGTVSNSIMTSPDGITWTSRTSPDTTWLDVAWSPELGLFAAVGFGATNRVMTSPDGITWTGQTAAAAITWSAITWSPELGLFVAIGQSGTASNTVMTSPDGITWTSRTIPSAYNYNGITWAPEVGLFVAVAFSGTNRILTSTDGITWTEQTMTVANQWVDISWSPERAKFVALAATGTNRALTSSGDLLYSTQSLDDDFLDEGRDVGSVQLLVKMRTGYVPSTLLASVSRDGGNVYQKIDMERIGSSDSFVGTSELFNELRNQTLFSQTSTNITNQFNLTDAAAFGQKIVITSTSVVKEIKLQLFRVGSPDGVLYASIVRKDATTDTPSLLSSDILATSDNIVAATDISTGASLITFTFPGVVLTPGTYFVTVATDAAYKSTWVLDTKTVKIDYQSTGSSGFTQYDMTGNIWGGASGSASLLYYLNGRVLDLRVLISSPEASTEMSAYGALYDLQTTGFTNSSKLMQRFDFNSTVDNLNEFTLTAFTPDPDLLTVYYIQGGQAFRYGAFSLDGHKIVFPVNTFDNGGVSAPITIVAVQNEGGSFDNSDKNGLLLASNHLGSTDASIDKSIAGMGIFLRRPDGVLREITIDNSDNIAIYSV